MRKYTLAFRIRDLVEKECEKVPPSMGLKILQLIEQHQEEDKRLQPESPPHPKH